MNRMKKLWAVLLLLVASGQVFADEGMWVLKELNKQNLERMKELGFTPSYEQLYSETDPCVANAVVIFGGGCSGITVSNEGLIFTNHHCGFGSIQQLSSVEHDYLKDGFVSQSKEEELPVPGLTVRYLRETVDVSDRINSQIASIKEEHLRLAAADSIGQAMADSVGNTEFQAADVVPFYNNNKYFLIVYDVFNDVRMVFAPPSSVGKFGGDTDNWMWPRHTGDFSVFRVYAGADNKPAAYSKDNKPYQPKYVAEVSLQGYQDKDYAMTIGFPGSTDRYLCSWGVQQRIEDSNKPRIEVRGIKQAIWKDAMLKSDEVRIKYASKYAGSSNYWKNSIGMNKGLANLKVIDRKREEEAAFAAWVAQDAKRKEVYGDVLNLLEKGYTSSSEYKKISTYLGEAFLSGAEIVKLARMIQSVDVKGSTPEEIDIFLEDNIKFLIVYDVFNDVRMVFAPPSSVGKFGGDTDNWMWPRHTGDFSVFRVYAGADNKPAAYSKDNKPYQPKYVAEVSLQGYQDKDYAMTIGFPGSTDRYLCSWGVQQRIEDSNKPRIEVRGIKQAIWKDAMLKSDEVRIKYASKYAGSSNYWKNSIGMNKGLANLKVIDRKREEEAAFAAWVAQDAKRKEVYGDVLNLLEKGYTSSSEYKKISTYLGEAFLSGAEIVKLARMIQSVDVKGSTPEEIDIFLEDNIKSFFKDYDASLDRKVLAAMMKIVKERVPAENLPDIYKKVDKKYKGDYEKYAADVFKKTSILSYDNIASMLKDPKKYAKLKKDPAAELSLSVLISLFELQQLTGDSYYDIAKGERLYFAGLKEMHSEKAFASDANFTMRVSYGSIGGYRPYDAAWYDYYTTQKGIFEKENPESDEFWVQPEILNLIRSKDFGQYANKDGELQLCFLSNNDITGGNSGSPVFDKNARLIGLAFDGNWEAMSGDIAFEPDLQRTISVDIRYVLYMIDKWGKCPRLIEELKLVK